MEELKEIITQADAGQKLAKAIEIRGRQKLANFWGLADKLVREEFKGYGRDNP